MRETGRNNFDSSFRVAHRRPCVGAQLQRDCSYSCPNLALQYCSFNIVVVHEHEHERDDDDDEHDDEEDDRAGGVAPRKRRRS